MSKDVEIKIFIERIDKLIPSDDNPRKIGRPEYEKLKQSLKDFPEMKELREIVVDEGLRVLGGHQRLYALKDLGYSDVKVKQVIGLSERKKREFMIKDNTASGDWDTDILANMWDVGELEDWGVKGFDLGNISGDPKEPAAKDSGSKEPIECPNCGHLIEF